MHSELLPGLPPREHSLSAALSAILYAPPFQGRSLTTLPLHLEVASSHFFFFCDFPVPFSLLKGSGPGCPPFFFLAAGPAKKDVSSLTLTSPLLIPDRKYFFFSPHGQRNAEASPFKNCRVFSPLGVISLLFLFPFVGFVGVSRSPRFMGLFLPGELPAPFLQLLSKPSVFFFPFQSILIDLRAFLTTCPPLNPFTRAVADPLSFSPCGR